MPKRKISPPARGRRRAIAALATARGVGPARHAPQGGAGGGGGSITFKDTGSRGFLNLPDHNDFKYSKVVVVPFGLEKSVTFSKGTAKGPQAIISASHEVELYGQDFKTEPYKQYGIATLAKSQIPIPKSHSSALKQLSDITANLLQHKKFPLILGGEHSLSGGSVKGVRKALGKPINILHIDAHSDLRPEYQNNPLSHASAMYLALPYISHIVQIGIRNTATTEAPVIAKLKRQHRLKLFTAEDVMLRQKPDYLKETISFLKGKPAYLTFDVDAFDLSIIGSSTGTPEPGGLSWYDAVAILRAAAEKLNIVGAEFVELLPQKNQHAPDFAVAKLIYIFLNQKFAAPQR